jgi:hypothetical protein
MGHADSAVLHDSTGNDTFDASGAAASMTGANYYEYVSGAGSVTAVSSGSGHDRAYQYDGTGACTFTANGTTSSTMAGTNNGVTFLNTALGFKFTYAYARHAGDTANLNAGAGVELFYGSTSSSYLAAYASTGALTMFDGVYGFSRVNAHGAPGDRAYVFNASVNKVTGFSLIPSVGVA